MHVKFEVKETWLHKINPSVKLLTLVFLFLLVLMIHNPTYMALFFIISVILFLFFSGHPWKRVFLFSLPVLFISISTTISMVFFGKGESTLFQWGLVHITEESLFRGLHIGFRSLTYGALGLIFALTTNPVYLFYSLMQQLKLPPKYAYSFLAGIRLIPIIVEEFQTIRNAHKVRGVKHDHFLQQWKRLSIPLLSQCIRRAFRIAVAMEAKRFDNGKDRTFYYKIGFSKFDVIFVCYFVTSIILLYFLSVEVPFFAVTDVRSIGG